MSEQHKRIYLSPPHMGGEEQKYLAEAFAENWIAPRGPNLGNFEREMAQYLGVKGTVAVSSCTAAIHISLRLLGVEQGDTVFCSSLTFVGSASPILYQKALPVFIDSEPGSWNMSPHALKEAFFQAERDGKLPKAVICVNLYGQSADFDLLSKICMQYGVPIIEDAAESLGATYKGRASGTLTELGVFSFNGNKIITTSGGGMLVSNNLEVLEKARFLAAQAREPTLYYQHKELGYNYQMSNLLAGVGRGQLQVLNDRVSSRRKIFMRYFRALKEIKGVDFMPEAEFGCSNRWLTTLTLNPDEISIAPGEIIEALEAENIEARMVWKPLHLQPLFQDSPYFPHEKGESFSDYAFKYGLCLPSGSSLSSQNQDRVIEIIKKQLKVSA